MNFFCSVDVSCKVEKYRKEWKMNVFCLINKVTCFDSLVEEPDVRTRKIVKVVTQTMVNGKVVDESSEVEQIEERKK